VPPRHERLVLGHEQVAPGAVPSTGVGVGNERAIGVPLLAEAAPSTTPSPSERARAVPDVLPERRGPRLFPLEPERRPVAAGIVERLETPRQTEPPAVHVHIGRIDVRAVETPAPPKPPPGRRTPRAPSLEEHLRARERGAG
jgi:hypothetical protein